MSKKQAMIAFAFGALIILLLILRPKSAEGATVIEQQSSLLENPLYSFAPDFERDNGIMDWLGDLARPGLAMPLPAMNIGAKDYGDVIIESPSLDTQCCRSAVNQTVELQPYSPAKFAESLAVSYGQVQYDVPTSQTYTNTVREGIWRDAVSSTAFYGYG